MDTMVQRRIVGVSAMIVLATGFIRAIQEGETLPSSRFLIGYGFAFFLTSVMTDLGVAFGAALALIIMVGTVLENADYILQWTQDRSTGKHGVTRVRRNVKKGTKTVVNAASSVLPGE